MSVDYAAGLSHYDDLGDCGLDEVFDKYDVVKSKVKTLAEWLRDYKGSCVVHVGAGLSTAAGIRDFRGKSGVWTEMLNSNKAPTNSEASSSGQLNLKSEDEQCSRANGRGVNRFEVRPFDQAEPTYSHLALKSLCQLGLVGHIVSQNVDGLFLKSNLKRSSISELHGDFYLDECTRCRSRFIRASASPTMRLQKSSVKCPRGADACKGYLRDTILDWESPIPHNELNIATRKSKRCKLHICIGTSLQLRPSRDLVCKSNTKLNNKLVIVNLQPTKFDQRADLVINYLADDVMKELANQLDLEIPNYDRDQDPTKDPNRIGTAWKR